MQSVYVVYAQLYIFYQMCYAPAAAAAAVWAIVSRSFFPVCVWNV